MLRISARCSSGKGTDAAVDVMVHRLALRIDEMAQYVAHRPGGLQFLELARLDVAIIGDRAVAGQRTDAEQRKVRAAPPEHDVLNASLAT